MKARFVLLMAAVLAVPVAGFSFLQLSSEERFSDYAAAVPTDAIARLQEQVNSGEVKLEFDENWGYLPSLLKVLHISPSSQVLVYSKTSFQLDKIAPWSPRAIYFNDEVYVGWVQRGNVVEFASVDPKLGAVFYTLEQQAEGQPKFERQLNNCLQCHDSSLNTGGVPGFMVQSVFTDRYGYPLPAMHNPVSSDRTPLAERFGGWYVTGTHGDQVHMGNFVAPEAAHEIGNLKIYLQRLNLTSTGNVTSLADRFNTEPYLSKGSDIASLMLLVHQTYVHNLITQAGREARPGGPTNRAEALVRGLLFVREAPLSAPIKGSETFASNFPKAGPHDHQGRSLRDLDLTHRLLRYPLSYLIYSEGFDALPTSVKMYVSRRLGEILTGKDDSPEFARLTQADREAIVEILQDTKPGFLDIGTRK